jgi:two-component system response regulator DesR
MTRGLRVLYVENDEALLGLLGTSLAIHPKVELLAKAGGSIDALEISSSTTFDSALVDINLGSNSLSGIELALRLRQINEHIGIVLLSQNITKNYLASLPGQFDYGWAAIQKSATLSIDHVVKVLQETSLGKTIAGPNPDTFTLDDKNLTAQISVRQRQIVGFAATGLDATAIAQQLGLTAVTVRQELSKAYKVLVPDPKPGTDLRTAAVLRFLRETRGLE